jgi:hypothetical protein
MPFWLFKVIQPINRSAKVRISAMIGGLGLYSDSN